MVTSWSPARECIWCASTNSFSTSREETLREGVGVGFAGFAESLNCRASTVFLVVLSCRLGEAAALVAVAVLGFFPVGVFAFLTTLYLLDPLTGVMLAPRLLAPRCQSHHALHGND